MQDKRIFVAVDISEEARHRVASYISGLRSQFSDIRAGWTHPEKLHLTMKFIGDSDEALLEKIIDSVVKVAGQVERFRLEIAGLGVFPSAKKARTLWLGTAGARESLKELSTALNSELGKIGIRPEKREFHGHLTIARLREPGRAQDLVTRHLQTHFEPVEFEVHEIVIYESKLQPTGSTYEKLKVFPLMRKD